MNEAEVSKQLVRSAKLILPKAVVFKHNDAKTAGIPDISISWRRKTLWVEDKYVTDHIHFRKLQHYFMCSLAEHGSGAYYVLFVEARGAQPRTVVVIRPKDLTEEDLKGGQPVIQKLYSGEIGVRVCDRFNYVSTASFLRDFLL